MSEEKDDKDLKEESKVLVARRGAVKGTLTRIRKRIEAAGGLADASLQLLLVMEEKALVSFGEYENINLELGQLDCEEDPTATENCYFYCMAALRTRISEATKRVEASSVSAGSSHARLKLPDVNITPFDGKYVEFRPFLELFNAFIHNDQNLTDIQKFFYLRGFLKDEAYDLVKNLPILGSSYRESMTILTERYDNKFKITQEHLAALFDMPTLTIKAGVTSLRTIISNTKQHIAALKNLGESVNKWDSVLVCLLLRKLDPTTANAYHLALNQSEARLQPTYNMLMQFLEGRALALENSEVGKEAASYKATGSTSKSVNVVNVREVKCLFCGKSNHKIFACPSFMLSSTKERLDFVHNRKLCRICLNAHSQKCKFHFKCQKCKQNHNTLLHSETGQPSSSEEQVGLRVGVVNVGANNIMSSMTQVLLPTAKVKLITNNGQEIIVKALLDSASQASFITSGVARELGKPLLPNHTEIVGIANTERTIRHAMQLDIFSCVYPYKVKANLLLVDQITSKLPQCPIDISKIKVPKNIKLADDSFHVTSEIGILLGADVFFQTLLPQDEQLQVEEGDAAQHRFVHTQFGYIVAGGTRSSSIQSSAVALFCQECNTDIGRTISNFWQTEKVPETFVEHVSEQLYCEKYFSETVKLENNQFEVSLPLKVPLCDINNALGDSLSLALKRFINLEKKLQKDSEFNREYKNFIHEFIELGHASYVDITLYDLSKDPIYFFAHHAVIKHDAITTKLRTVFDGSMKTSNKVSLNDLMLNGPIVQQELFDILLLFRLHEYFFVCDIRRMFRNIVIAKDQRSLQNILWRDHPDEEIKCIQLSRVCYGLKSSNWLATRCLLELVNRYGDQYPLAALALINSTYVDDVIYTDSSLPNIIEAKSQLIELLSRGSFELHKWSANHKAILSNIPEQQQSFGVELNKDIKTLGLEFEIQSDSFRITCPTSNEIPKTKRQILSYISQFYDPLGLAGPVLVQAKIIMQKLWQSNVDWDSNPTPLLQQEWLKFYNDLQQMAPIAISRNVCSESNKSIQIVGFADASITAFGCAIYLRVIDKHDKVTMSLLCSKSRIAPKANKLTIPRLELNAALLLAKLSVRVYETLSKKVTVDSVTLFSDSQVVLAWQRTDPILINAYVANRVKMINEYSKTFQWSYVRTDQNPADCLSRGIPPTELQSNQLWWHGPSFLYDVNYNFSYKCEIPKELPEVKTKTSELVCAASHNKAQSFLGSILDKYSDINKAVNVLSYVLRFIKNVRPGTIKIKENFVRFSEATQALHLFIKDEQGIYFHQDLASLQAGRQTSSYLKSLNPFIDADGLLRVGGRLQHSSLPFSQRHQIILPKESRVTHLIIENEHLKLFHAGQKLILSSLQQRYWIVNGLRLIKKFIYKCTICFRHKAITATQLMGSLPFPRVNINRCFIKVGIDHAGPIMIKQSRLRNVITSKGYICIYVCFVTKAVHIELVSNLETETFLASFRRFIARRNVPSDVYCDNAGTFKAANTQLSELYKLYNSKSHQTQVQNEASKLGIKFNFIPSYSPVFAGLWEAAVKSVKHHLKRVLGSHVLTYEELNTVLVQIEGILNSRPITPMSSDSEDLSYLTPGHFLTGERLNCIPDQDLTNLPDNRLSLWSRCTALQQQFWRYWSKHYLNVLQNRPKWKDSLPNVKVGDLVILRELDTPPMTWPMARVTKVYVGSADGLVRALEVKKANGNVHKTSITKICILPIEQAT